MRSTPQYEAVRYSTRPSPWVDSGDPMPGSGVSMVSSRPASATPARHNRSPPTMTSAATPKPSASSSIQNRSLMKICWTTTSTATSPDAVGGSIARSCSPQMTRSRRPSMPSLRSVAWMSSLRSSRRILRRVPSGTQRTIIRNIGSAVVETSSRSWGASWGRDGMNTPWPPNSTRTPSRRPSGWRGCRPRRVGRSEIFPVRRSL